MRSKMQLAVVVMLLALAGSLTAQTRYLDEVFTDVKITKDVKYGENYSVLSGNPQLENLIMDVYEPENDTGAIVDPNGRPVIILTHAGSFLPKDLALPFGNKEDSCWVEMCTQLAKRGFVAVSMNYRIGWNPFANDQETKASTIVNAVYRAGQDAKAAIRYFRSDAANADTYNIDPYRVVLGGSNSGGYVALAAIALNDTNELKLPKFQLGTGDPMINQAVTGGFYGEGGWIGVNAPLNNPGYSSAIQVGLNMGGAIGDTLWMNAGEAPVVNVHGIADPLTPYMTNIVIVSATGDPVVEVSGSFNVAKTANRLGNNDVWVNAGFSDVFTDTAMARSSYEGLFPFPGPANGYEPWAWYDSSLNKIDTTGSGFGSAANPFATRAKAEMYIDTILNYFVPRALEVFNNLSAADSAAVETADPDDAPVTPPTSVRENFSDVAMDIFPNPASNGINVRLTNSLHRIDRVDLFDVTGKLIRSEDITNDQLHVVQRGNLVSGVYFINVALENGEQTFRKVVFK